MGLKSEDDKRPSKLAIMDDVDDTVPRKFFSIFDPIVEKGYYFFK